MLQQHQQRELSLLYCRMLEVAGFSTFPEFPTSCQMLKLLNFDSAFDPGFEHKKQYMTSGFLPHTISYVTYDIVCADVRYRTYGVGCRMLYRIYDIVYTI